MDEFRIERVPASEKAVFIRYFQFYLYEHAEFTGKKPTDGMFSYPWFDLYWQQQNTRWPFWMRVAGDIVALALIRFDEEDGCYELAEFFVVNQYRGQGLGDRFAKDIILRFNGRWKLNQVKRNERAVAFWRRVLGEIADYAEAPLTREDKVERIEQRFVIGLASAQG